MRVLVLLAAMVLGGCVADVEETPPPEDEPAVCCEGVGAPPDGYVWGCYEGTTECIAVSCEDWPQRCAPPAGPASGGQGGSAEACDCHPWKACTWTEPGCEHMRTSGNGGAGGG
jgi:hypothetical protein